MSVVLIGRDVAVYTISPGTSAEAFDFEVSSTVNMLGRFKNVTLRAKKEWVDVPASSAGEVERRRTLFDWSMTLENQIRSGGDPQITAILNFDHVAVVFEEEGGGGAVITAYGGIQDVEYKRGKDEGISTMEVIDVGSQISPTGLSLSYVFP